MNPFGIQYWKGFNHGAIHLITFTFWRSAQPVFSCAGIQDKTNEFYPVDNVWSHDRIDHAIDFSDAGAGIRWIFDIDRGRGGNCDSFRDGGDQLLSEWHLGGKIGNGIPLRIVNLVLQNDLRIQLRQLGVLGFDGSLKIKFIFRTHCLACCC